VICTLAWRCVGEVFAERYGFIGSSGPVLETDAAGVFSGAVEVDFTEHDKPVFVRQLCESLGVQMSDVFHVGDSVSDIPLFEAAGFSVALNANRQAKAKAQVALDRDSLFDILGVIPGLRSTPRR
jgi:phosphoserine phosphatase